MPISYTVHDKTGLISDPAMVIIDYPVSFGGNLGTSGSLRDQVMLELERYSFSVRSEELEFEAARSDGSSFQHG